MLRYMSSRYLVYATVATIHGGAQQRYIGRCILSYLFSNKSLICKPYLCLMYTGV
jgi:hypothetical protein